MRAWRKILTAGLILAMAIGSPGSLCQACCPAFARDANIRIADQTLLIVWDPATQTQHFVRQAAFKQIDPADNFGFLVPSPTQPTVEEAEGQVFERLEAQSRPQPTYTSKWQVAPFMVVLYPFMLSSKTAMEVNVRTSVAVIERKQVAGYDVAVLKADDTQALTSWLADNGYDARPQLQEWARPYVADGWYITAFKYAQVDGQRVAVGSVRMSFQTARAIFPYRVPTDQIAPERQGNLLRTYVVGPGRATGTLGTGPNAQPWRQARLRYARPLSLATDTLLEGALPASAIEALRGSWLTTFDDNTWPSGADDLWFDFDSAAQDYQETQHFVQRRFVPIPLDLLGLGALGIIWWRRKNTLRVK